MSNHIMSAFHSLLFYTVWSLILLTNYICFEIVLDSNPEFVFFYETLAHRISIKNGRSIAPTLHNLIIAVLALVALEVESAVWYFLVSMIQRLSFSDSDGDTAQHLVDPSPRNPNVVRLLGEEGFVEVRRRILQATGQYPPLDSFPILDAPSLRPYHRFTDPALYDRGLLSLVRSNYHKIVGKHDRTIGSTAFFAKANRILQDMDKQTTATPLPISFQRHPRLVHTHLFFAQRNSLPKMSDVVFQFQELVKGMSPVINPLHRELRVLVVYLLFLLGRLEQAAACDDLINCIESLELIDNVTTSLRGLCEVAYSVREKAHKATSS